MATAVCRAIAHIILWVPWFTSYGNSCLQGAGGYSILLGFWWHIEFPRDIITLTLLLMSNSANRKLVSINVLKFITVIINYCAMLHFLLTKNVTTDPYPVFLNVMDNSSMLSWTTHTCKKLKIGHHLARFICSLLINSLLGINL